MAKFKIQLSLSDGSTIDSEEFTVPDGKNGEPGAKGDTGATPVITAKATVGATVGTPAVEVVKSGTPEAPTLTFNFSNLKGQQGAKGDAGAKGDKGDNAPTISSVSVLPVT